MTIQEIYELIKQKKESAERDYLFTLDEMKNFIKENGRYQTRNKKLERLKGEIEAYTDVLILIETSGVLENGSNNLR